MENCTDLNKLAKERINFGESLITILQPYENLEGVKKLERKIKQELNFLNKVFLANSVKEEHINCSNLKHFAALINKLKESENCVSVNKVFNLDGERLNVDIVCDKGLTWIKVIARNPKSLTQICLGDASYGVRTVIDQADDYIECAKSNPCLFQIPKVVFYFDNGIEENVAKELEAAGVVVRGKRVFADITEDVTFSHEVSTISQISKVNLDVSAMVAYVSALTNGHCNYVFEVQALTQQAEWESERPVKPILDAFFRDKQLFCCQTAKNSFDNIVNTVGGPNERMRAAELMQKITVLPDDATIDDIEKLAHHKSLHGRSINDKIDVEYYFLNKALPICKRVRERSRIIFRFGDRIQAVTVTSNRGFVSSAKQQGVNFVVFVHESRALTEQKQADAILRH